MEQWQKDLIQIVETVADEVERLFLGMSEMVDAFFELSEEIAEEVHNSIANEVDQFLDIYGELEDIIVDPDPGFPYAVEPSAEQHPACVGCQNYHGHVYGGNLLVCAIHPHGWDDGNCPDWEQE